MAEPAREVRAAFAAFPEAVRPGLLDLRALILSVADEIGVSVTEALRWGQPAYLAPKGSTIRLGAPKSGGYALYVICTTTLIDDWRAVAGDGFRFEGRRAVLLRAGEAVDEAALALLIRAALTYHER